MRKSLINVTILSLSFLLILSVGFYFFVLKPRLELPSALLKMETTLAENHLNLVQNRLSIVGLAGLDPSSPELSSEKGALLQTALETNSTGLEQLAADTPTETGINSELEGALPALLEENTELLKKQKGLLDKLKELAETNKNIFSYNPEQDLGQLHPVQNREEIIERASSAMLGLREIGTEVENNDMSRSLEKTENLFEELIIAVEAEDISESGRLFDEIALEFLNMRRIGLEMEFSLIESPETLELLKDQTNLILQYEYWLEKVDLEQKEISNLKL